MMEAIEREVLSWANMVRCSRMHMDPMEKLPQGVPGNSQHCVIARCWQVQDERNIREAHYSGKPMVRVGRVQVNSSQSRIEFAWARYPEDYPRTERLDIGHPMPVAQFIEAFDNGRFPHLVDEAMVKLYGPKSKPLPMPQHLVGTPVVADSVITMEMLEKVKDQLSKVPPPVCFQQFAEQMIAHPPVYHAPDWAKYVTPEAPVAKPLVEEAETST